MPSAPLIFMDTETTSLEHDADVWEFAAIRREPDGTETELHLFIEHDEEKCRQLPEPFLSDHLARFPGHGQEMTRIAAARDILRFSMQRASDERPHVVGACPDFDVQRLERMFRAETIRRPEWHYHLVDVENLAVGWLARNEGKEVQLPWDSEILSRSVNVNPDDFARHTAMGDAKWARAIYDAVMGGAA